MLLLGKPSSCSPTILEKANDVFPTSQMANLSLFFFDETIPMGSYEMCLDLLWTGPFGMTEGALMRLLVLVSDMPFEFLGSLIFFVTTNTATPLPGSPVTIHGTLYAFCLWTPLASCMP